MNHHLILDSPVGKLTLVASDTALFAVLWELERPGRVVLEYGPAVDPDKPDHPVLAAVKQQLTEYFDGQRKEFDLPLAPQGTPFQQQVWQGLLTIPYGETLSYGALAARIGAVPGASRAVGAANGRNPISIIIPCHRVIGSSGKLTGFAGGLENKAHLLSLESRQGVLFFPE